MIETSVIFLFCFFLFVYIKPNVNGKEACERYTSFYYKSYEKRYCVTYCCGLCTNRYCCSDIDKRLDQAVCPSEKCLSYYDKNGHYHFASDCNGLFCCGSCKKRYCCASSSSMLNQTICFIRDGYNQSSSKGLHRFYWIIGTVCAVIACSFIVGYKYHSKKNRAAQLETLSSINNVTYSRNTNRIAYQPDYRYNTSANRLINNGPRLDAPSHNDIDKNCETNANDDLPPSYESLTM